MTASRSSNSSSYDLLNEILMLIVISLLPVNRSAYSLACARGWSERKREEDQGRALSENG
jgi:hypothetical protein